jgi:hypothetical protein
MMGKDKPDNGNDNDKNSNGDKGDSGGKPQWQTDEENHNTL